MGKQIVLTTVGSFGDLHPFLAVGIALKARGCDVTVAAMGEYKSKVEMEGLTFHELRPHPGQIKADTGLDDAGLLLNAAEGATSFVIGKMVAPYVQQTYADLMAVLKDADLVVASSFSIVARLAVQKLNLPLVSVVLFPLAFISAERRLI